MLRYNLPRNSTTTPLLGLIMMLRSFSTTGTSNITWERPDSCMWTMSAKSDGDLLPKRLLQTMTYKGWTGQRSARAEVKLDSHERCSILSVIPGHHQLPMTTTRLAGNSACMPPRIFTPTTGPVTRMVNFEMCSPRGAETTSSMHRRVESCTLR